MKLTVGFVLAALFVPTTMATIRTRIGKALSTECRNIGRGNRKCKFATDDLVLEETSKIALTVKQGGRKIVCNQKTSNSMKAVWYGECDGDARDANFIKRIDHNGKDKVFGSIRVGSDICQIRPNAVGEGEITCTAESDFEDEEEPLDGFGQVGTDSGRDLSVAGNNPSAFDQTEAMHAIRGSGSRSRNLYDDSGANIDIMVVWTKDAECMNSNLAVGCIRTNTTESNMRGLIDLAIAETNAAFVFSGINTELRLVHAYSDTAYIEPTTNPYNTALNSLRLKTDGNLDSAHVKRTLYGADAVHLIMGMCTLPST